MVREGDRGGKEGDCNGEEVVSTLAPRPSYIIQPLYSFSLATLHRMQIMSVEGLAGEREERVV